MWLTLLLAGAAGLALARLVYRYRAYPFDGDEVNHALPSLMMAQAMIDGEWIELGRIFDDQSFYPPAVALLKAAAFVLFEPSFLVARLFSVACLVLAIGVIYAICVEIDAERGGIAGLIAAALTLSSALLMANAGLSMVELPGLFVSMLLLWVYVRALKQGTVPRLLLAGFLLTGVFLTKYTYGLAAVAAVGLTEVTLLPLGRGRGLGPELRARLAGRWPYLFGPFLLIMALWFLGPDKLAGFASYTQPLSGDEAWLDLANAWAYLRSVAIHNQPSPLFTLVSLGGLVWAAGHWRRPTLRPMLIYLVAGMAMITLINHPVNPRFILTFVPAAHILTGLMIAHVIGRARERPWRARAISVLVVIVMLAAASAPNVYRRWARMDELMAVMVETDPVVNEVAGWLLEQIPPGRTVVMVNYLDQFDPNLFTWYRGLRHRPDLAQPVGGVILTPPATESPVAMRQEILAGQPDYLVLIEGGPWGHPFWPDYTAAMEDALAFQDRREFILTSSEGSQGWLDANAVTGDDWQAVNRSDARRTMTAGVLVYKVR